MNLFRVMELVAVILLFVGVVSQVIFPMMVRRPLFPYFRNTEKLNRQLARAHEQADERALERSIERQHKRKA